MINRGLTSYILVEAKTGIALAVGVTTLTAAITTIVPEATTLTPEATTLAVEGTALTLEAMEARTEMQTHQAAVRAIHQDHLVILHRYPLRVRMWHILTSVECWIERPVHLTH
jgi:histidine ammonia-lyase